MYCGVIKVREIILGGFLGLLFILQAGCQTVVVSGNTLQETSGAPAMAGNDSTKSSWARDIDGINSQRENRTPASAELKEPCRIKFHSSYTANRWMVIEGTLGSGRKYPVILDTGASVALFVNDLHIKENNLAFTPLNKGNDNSPGWGKCDLPELHLGQVTLDNRPCYYREMHTETRLLGLPLTKSNPIIAGLPALRSFKYIAFDSIGKEVELSPDKVFEPERPEEWARYSFRIEEHRGGSALLFVKIPIAGAEAELQLDTGSGKGLAISEELWEKMRKNIPSIKLGRGKDLYPYIGSIPCKRGTVPALGVGDRIVTNAKISIFPDDSPIVDGCSGLLGMQYFQDTALVLDFERNLMWVKNPPSR